MAKKVTKRRAWTPEHLRTLKTTARKKTHAGRIAKVLKRTEGATRQKEDFENGRHYYEMHGKQISIPNNPGQRPSTAALEWHQTTKFLG